MLSTKAEWDRYREALLNKDVDAALKLFFLKETARQVLLPINIFLNIIHGCIRYCPLSFLDLLTADYSGVALGELKSLSVSDFPLDLNNREFLFELDSSGHAITSATRVHENDFAYGKLLLGKQLLVVGPCSAEKHLLNQKNSVVIHMNMPSKQHLEQFPKSEHVLYLNGQYIQALEEERLFHKDEIRKFDFLCLKRPSSILETQNLPIRHFPNLQTLRYGSSTILTGAIYDLLHYQFESLILTGFTLYSKGFEYAKSYQNFKLKDKDTRKIIDTFEDHDPLSNFSFLKLLFHAKIFDCDVNLSSILQLKHRDYIRSIFDYMLS